MGKLRACFTHNLSNSGSHTNINVIHKQKFSQLWFFLCQAHREQDRTHACLRSCHMVAIKASAMSGWLLQNEGYIQLVNRWQPAYTPLKHILSLPGVHVHKTLFLNAHMWSCPLNVKLYNIKWSVEKTATKCMCCSSVTCHRVKQFKKLNSFLSPWDVFRPDRLIGSIPK